MTTEPRIGQRVRDLKPDRDERGDGTWITAQIWISDEDIKP